MSNGFELPADPLPSTDDFLQRRKDVCRRCPGLLDYARTYVSHEKYRDDARSAGELEYSDDELDMARRWEIHVGNDIALLMSQEELAQHLRSKIDAEVGVHTSMMKATEEAADAMTTDCPGVCELSGTLEGVAYKAVVCGSSWQPTSEVIENAWVTRTPIDGTEQI